MTHEPFKRGEDFRPSRAAELRMMSACRKRLAEEVAGVPVLVAPVWAHHSRAGRSRPAKTARVRQPLSMCILE